MLGRASAVLVVAAGLAVGGCQTCNKWKISPGTTNLGPEETAALERIDDGSCEVTILPLMPPVISNRHRTDSTGEGETARRTLREENGGLFDLLTFHRRESTYGAGGRLIEWREQRSFLLGLTQASESGAAGADTISSWRLLGGLIGSEKRGDESLSQLFWITF